MTPKEYQLDGSLEKLFAWSGIVWTLTASLAFFGSGLVPVQSPSTSAEDLVAFLSEHKFMLLAGMQFLLIGACTCMTSWGVGLAYQVRKYANPSPLIFYYSILVAFAATFIGMLTGVYCSMILFRIETMDPATIQGFFDLLWFMFLIPWAPFTAWQFLIGLAIVNKTNPQTLFPRWTGYFCFWAGILEVPSAFAMYFHHGPFSYSGAVTFYVPGVSFFMWVFILACIQIKRWPRAREGTPFPQQPESISGSSAVGSY